MKATWRDLRRARARTAASVLALALAIAAIGVFAVPAVTRDSLRRLAADDRLAHVTLDTTAISDPAALASVPGLTAVATRVSVTVPTGGDTGSVTVVGIDPAHQTIDIVRAHSGRLPRTDGEVALGGRVGGSVDGTVLATASRSLLVVGTADTAALAGDDVVYTTTATAERLGGLTGPNQVVARVADPTAPELDAAIAALRRALAEQGVAVTALPVRLPGGAHPVEESIRQISTIIGMLGVVAGIVALVLLASTTNAIVTERSRDAAILRALGAPGRAVRRELRRVALAIATLGLVIGLPLGLVVSNVIARMVLDRFAGITPALGWSPAVVVGSVVFALLGARLISGRAARRLTRLPLAEALRDREGTPFGRRFTDRVFAGIHAGTLSTRMAVRSTVRRRGRAIALVAQIACAVGAAACVASLGSSVGQFNQTELRSWSWSTTATPQDPGYPYDASRVDATVGNEAGLHAEGLQGDWYFDVWGIEPQTQMVDTTVSRGTWLDGTPGTAVMAEHIAHQLGYSVGDTVTLELANGPAPFRIVGLHPLHGVAVFVDRSDLATRLGAGDRANVVWSSSTVPLELTAGTASTTVRRADLYAADQADRNAIVGIFVAIGVIVSGVAALGAVSTVGVSLFERRRELAVVRALGARRGQVRRLIGLELAPLATIGWVVGLGFGWLAAKAIMGFFEASSGVDLGYTFAVASVPVAAVAVAAFVVLVATAGARGLDRRAPASILRAAS